MPINFTPPPTSGIDNDWSITFRPGSIKTILCEHNSRYRSTFRQLLHVFRVFPYLSNLIGLCACFCHSGRNEKKEEPIAFKQKSWSKVIFYILIQYKSFTLISTWQLQWRHQTGQNNSWKARNVNSPSRCTWLGVARSKRYPRKFHYLIDHWNFRRFCSVSSKTSGLTISDYS